MHDQAACPTNNVLDGVLRMNKADDRPGGLYNLRRVVLAIFLGHTRLCQRTVLVLLLDKMKGSRTMYVSPHPPSSI